MSGPVEHNVSLTTVPGWFRRRRWVRVQCSAGCLDVLYPHGSIGLALDVRDRHQKWSHR